MKHDAKDPIADAIQAAEEVCDPLVGLIEKSTNDSGSPFTPEVLQRLASLKKDDRATFESLRTQLRQCGCRVTALDDAIATESGDIGGRGPTQADILIELASSAELFHTSDKTGFAELEIDGHRETWPIRSKGFRRWLAGRFFDVTQRAANSEALQSALGVIEAKADFDSQFKWPCFVGNSSKWAKYYSSRYRTLSVGICAADETQTRYSGRLLSALRNQATKAVVFCLYAVKLRAKMANLSISLRLVRRQGRERFNRSTGPEARLRTRYQKEILRCDS